MWKKPTLVDPETTDFISHCIKNTIKVTLTPIKQINKICKPSWKKYELNPSSIQKNYETKIV